MSWLPRLGFACLLVIASSALVAAREVPKGKASPGVVKLLDDDTETLNRQLNNDGSLDGTKVSRDFRDFYSGVCSVRVTPFQRFSSRLPGWAYQITEKPGPAQYRYLRFAWKRVGGDGIMIQLHTAAGSWNQRYVAGKAGPSTATWGARLFVTDKVPAEWTVVTRDLFKDFGAFTLTGFALTPMEGGTAGLFDHIYLGRTIEELDQASAAAFGKAPLEKPLGRRALEQLWQELGSRDVAVAGNALRTLVAGRKDSVPFVKEQLRAKDASPDEKRIARLIADLDDNRFRVREAASRELEKLGELAVPFLDTAARASPSNEVRRRAREILQKRNIEEGSLSADQARGLRAIRVLEWSEARQVLEALAEGPSESALTQEARRALARLRGRP
jgi:hypothetical protein